MIGNIIISIIVYIMILWTLIEIITLLLISYSDSYNKIIRGIKRDVQYSNRIKGKIGRSPEIEDSMIIYEILTIAFIISYLKGLFKKDRKRGKQND